MTRALHYASSYILSENYNVPTLTSGNFQVCYSERQYYRWQNPCPCSRVLCHVAVQEESSNRTEELHN